MTMKLEEPILQVTGWVNGRVEIAVTRSCYRLLCGDQAQIPLRTQELE